MGWSLSGFHRCVYIVALRRAQLWSLDEGDHYRKFFTSAASNVLSWSYQSLWLLQTFAVPDWPSKPVHVRNLDSYKLLVRDILTARHAPVWQRVATEQSSDVQYVTFCSAPGGFMGELRNRDLPWEDAVNLRSFCRLRAAIMPFMHRQGKFSRARLQTCVACGETVEHGLLHTLCFCPHWAPYRVDVMEQSGICDQLPKKECARSMLAISPQSNAFSTMIKWAAAIDKSSRNVLQD